MSVSSLIVSQVVDIFFCESLIKLSQRKKWLHRCLPSLPKLKAQKEGLEAEWIQGISESVGSKDVKRELAELAELAEKEKREKKGRIESRR